jgi:UDP-N-acetylmuramoyl-tripeptide--D-alanyl-D-alanine ligase
MDDTGMRIAVKTPSGEFASDIPATGEHQLLNALAAAAAAHALGAGVEQIRAGLAAARPAAMRFEIRSFEPGITVVNDAYNANPASMRAALAALGLLPASGRRALVLGDMLELGPASAEEHRQLGAAAAATAPALLVAVGAFAGETASGARAAGLNPAAILTAADADGAAAHLESWLRHGDLVLLKGSRGVRLERVLERLLADGALRKKAAGSAAAAGRTA